MGTKCPLCAHTKMKICNRHKKDINLDFLKEIEKKLPDTYANARALDRIEKELRNKA